MVTSYFIQQPRRTWRGVLAALISFALVLSFLHGWCVHDDDGMVTIASVQADCAPSGKGPADTGSAPHGDHCLAHVTIVDPQESAATVEYITRIIRMAVMLAPDAADLASPFKPPRA